MDIKRFEKRLTNLDPDIWDKIAKITELKGSWVSGANLDPQVLSRLKRYVLATSTGASTRIEGAKLSDEDVENLMRGIGVQKFTARDKAEVKGYYELLSNIFDHYKTTRFNESTVKHFHKELLKYVEKDERHRGDYKKGENEVQMTDAEGNVIAVLFKTTPAYLAPKETQEAIEWTIAALEKQRPHPLLVIGNFIVEFLNIHPFQDGNGRLSRILTNLLLLQQGYLYMPYVSHEKLIEDNKPDYYLALRKSQKTFKTKQEDVSPWLHFFFDTLLKQSQMAVELLSKENVEKLLSPQQLKVWLYLQTVNEATPLEMSKNAGVSRPTVNQVLVKLLRLKKVERIGQGSATRYRKL